MSDTTVIDTTTTEIWSGGEPHTRRRRTHTVRSKQRVYFSVDDIYDLAEALQAAGAPGIANLRIDTNADGAHWMVVEWSEQVAPAEVSS